MNALIEKIKEVLSSVLPIYVIVLVLNFTLTPMSGALLLDFTLSTFWVIIGLALFLMGVDLSITPLGTGLGGTMTKSGKLWVLAIAGLILGFLISVAEPSLQILAGQVSEVTSGAVSKASVLIVVSLGIAVMLVAGLIRIVYNVPLYKVLIALYAVILVLAFFITPEYLAIAFDASGATTGALAVPFILALALGVSSLKKDSKASEKDSFGLVAVTSTGAIIGVQFMAIFGGDSREAAVTASTVSSAVIDPDWARAALVGQTIIDSMIAVLPLLAIFLVYHFKISRLPLRQFFRILKGFIYALIGLIFFLIGVNSGFMDMGTEIGSSIAQYSEAVSIAIGFVLGVTAILAEPAVYMLTKQIETVTSGYVKRGMVLVALSAGVGIAVGLSILRIVVPDIQLWHYLLPSYIIALGLTFITPKLFVGIGFDSGGVATGPMIATFILAYSKGVASAIESADVLADAFGMIALVATMPIITLQLLGLIYKMGADKREGTQSAKL